MLVADSLELDELLELDVELELFADFAELALCPSTEEVIP
jgi:hypothetical protein